MLSQRGHEKLQICLQVIVTTPSEALIHQKTTFNFGKYLLFYKARVYSYEGFDKTFEIIVARVFSKLTASAAADRNRRSRQTRRLNL